MPSGIIILPSIPERKNSGKKQATIINVEFNIGIRTSFDASDTTSNNGIRCSCGFRRFSRKRLYTFSTSTIASSTSEPMAIANPPRLIVLIVSPKPYITNTAINIAKGIAVNEITVVRKFIKKKKSTTTTNTAPSSKALRILPIELSMKRDCRKISVDTLTSPGSVRCKSRIDSSTRSVSSSVFVFGCFVTVTNTAGFPRSDANPSFGAFAPTCTRATSAKVMG